jgi:hypothetical protein
MTKGHNPNHGGSHASNATGAVAHAINPVLEGLADHARTLLETGAADHSDVTEDWNDPPSFFGWELHGHPVTVNFIVNDVMMCFFFGLAVKEITEAVLPGGSLFPISKAVNPLLGTVGGVLGPIVFYFALCGIMDSLGMCGERRFRPENKTCSPFVTLSPINAICHHAMQVSFPEVSTSLRCLWAGASPPRPTFLWLGSLRCYASGQVCGCACACACACECAHS